MTKDETYTPEMKERRRKAWEKANASVLMEGGIVTDEARAMQERHINGEITSDEYHAWLDSVHRRRWK